MTNRLINRNTKTITFSLPPEMAEQVQDVMRDEGRTMSELVREALRNYMEEREWLRTIRYERLRARLPNRKIHREIEGGQHEEEAPTAAHTGGALRQGVQRPAGQAQRSGRVQKVTRGSLPAATTEKAVANAVPGCSTASDEPT